jgi:hypothetical protein
MSVVARLLVVSSTSLVWSFTLVVWILLGLEHMLGIATVTATSVASSSSTLVADE